MKKNDMPVLEDENPRVPALFVSEKAVIAIGYKIFQDKLEMLF